MDSEFRAQKCLPFFLLKTKVKVVKMVALKPREKKIKHVVGWWLAAEKELYGIHNQRQFAVIKKRKINEGKMRVNS